MQLLNGAACSQQIRQEIALEVEAIVAAGKRLLIWRRARQ